MFILIFSLLLTGVVIDSRMLLIEKSGNLSNETSPIAPSADKEIETDENHDIDNELGITFHLFTEENKVEGSVLKVDDSKSLNYSHFKCENPTKVIVHGWSHSSSEPWVKSFTENFLIKGNFNVITVDWTDSRKLNYLTSAYATRKVGAHLAKLLKCLVTEKQLSLDDVHLLGHSLGAHIAGVAGNHLGGKVGRITAMDAAAPLFTTIDAAYRVDPSDAKFVDAIHTNGGGLGLGLALTIGHADFFPNGGAFQPGCGLFSLACSHERSFDFMMESVIHPKNFPAVPCNSYRDFQYENCKNNTLIAYMGEDVDVKTRGVFYLNTNSHSPFGKGSPR